MEIQRHRAPIRVALLFLTITTGILAVWILLAPRASTTTSRVPGFTGYRRCRPYNEHLERDFGAACFGLAVLTGLAAYWMDRRVIQAAALTLVAAGLPHLIYHLTTTGHYSTSNNVASLFGLALDVAYRSGSSIWSVTARSGGDPIATARAEPEGASPYPRSGPRRGPAFASARPSRAR